MYIYIYLSLSGFSPCEGPISSTSFFGFCSSPEFPPFCLSTFPPSFGARAQAPVSPGTYYTVVLCSVLHDYYLLYRRLLTTSITTTSPNIYPQLGCQPK